MLERTQNRLIARSRGRHGIIIPAGIGLFGLPAGIVVFVVGIDQ